MSASKVKMRERKLRNQPVSVQYPSSSTNTGGSGINLFLLFFSLTLVLVVDVRRFVSVDLIDVPIYFFCM